MRPTDDVYVGAFRPPSEVAREPYALVSAHLTGRPAYPLGYRAPYEGLPTAPDMSLFGRRKW
ncbi:hypothetical protein JD82_02816 [Prauserella rugosa]|uniref:Uncharacterized protein n=1 Tax=Prauserella rugosa TaxID=43354 RepID=A0A660CJ07_9PSEU|nr:hypothetical protein JD82_02816 [Prauserella rugosa]